MGSNQALSRPIIFRVLDSSLSEASRIAAVTAKLSLSCADPFLYADMETCLKDIISNNTDVLVIDLETIGNEDGLASFAVRCPNAVIIAISSQGSISRAVTAMRSGAHDFLTKPFSLDALASKILFQIEQHNSLPSQKNTPEPFDSCIARTSSRDQTTSDQPHANDTPQGLDRLIGSSASMRKIYDQIIKMAPSDAPVFITGESGTGKELCAEALHRMSLRPENSLVTINCAAIPRDLIESEIFGHVRGAFTGATENRIGAAEKADGGTLFLDEIGEMDLMLQSKLLRFLQTGTFQRLGETQTRRVNARIICATNRNPLAEVSAGRFREDLYYRLHVLPVSLPPLRERREDILKLATSFLERFAHEERRGFKSFDADTAACLLSYGWPGNVRQLENTIRQIVVMNDGPSVTLAMLPMIVRDPSSRSGIVMDLARERSRLQPAQRPFETIEPLWAQERRIIEDALNAFDGNIAMAAAALEISPSTIYRKRQSWEERSAMYGS